ncbi:polysaccharide pyruvyl transferase family protein [Flavobacterium sangjuense]|uniref:Polysaccharide pyruvyl transferase domain-containing protein n=1 Tax=Flavobacterium sangjuense TaxID=2518177 RepID=A0A4P7PSQ1_9FLAO|nr:polysaccharide pyruvyl transferase family protein [Flavobacterium sangjuense]QBZ97869.1 hypothetical protein GS03_01367 [Flavobacterium sangjuense]
MSNILISTKLKTTNIGNQALSDELILMAREFTTENNRFKVTGRPVGLDKYKFDSLDKLNPVAHFEGIAQKIAEKARKLKKLTFDNGDLAIVKTNLLDVEGNIVKTEKLRRIARKVRRFYYSFFLYSKKYENRLALYSNMDYYLYSGAGEIGFSDFFLRQLLDLRVAQLLGVKTCAINQSVELTEGIEKEILMHVYEKMHKIVVRGEISKTLLVSNNINQNIITVCPDTAFRNKVEIVPKKTFDKSIALNITPKTYDKYNYDTIIKKLLEHNYKITFVSNDPMGEKELAEQLHKKYNFPIIIKSLNYKEYSEFIKEFDVLISSRLHSCELALTAGVPVVPVEGNVHKTTEVLSFVEYPISVVNAKSDSFVEELWANILYVENNFIAIQNWILDNRMGISENATKNIISALD